MANTTAVIKVPEDIEYRIIGNAFGMMIACGGLLTGVMVSERSLDYWRDDIVPLGLLVVLGFCLSRNCIAMLSACLAEIRPTRHHPSPRAAATKEKIQQEHAAIAQLPASSKLSPEQVVEQVVKRIEAQKAEASKKNKLAN